MNEQLGEAIAGAILLAQAKVTPVKKADKIKTGTYSYSYASSEDVIQEARDCLHAHGLVLACVGWDSRREDAGIWEDNQQWDYWVRVSYCLIHESGESMPITSDMAVIPGKGKPLDKAMAGALTYDLGYTLRGLLLMPRVEDEPDKRDDSEYRPRGYQDSPKRAPAKPKPKAKATTRKAPDTVSVKLSKVLAKLNSKFGVSEYSALEAIGVSERSKVTAKGVEDLIKYGQKLGAQATDAVVKAAEDFSSLAPPPVG